jgi:hypothetical protein
MPILTLTAKASAAILPHRFVGHAGAYPTAAASALGVSRTKAADGEDFQVDVLGTSLVEASAAILAGASVEVAADGKAVTKSTGVAVARLAPGAVATAAGQLVEVVLIPT